MILTLLNQTQASVKKPWLERWLEELARQLARRGHRGLAKKELVVVFVTQPEIRRLNQAYRSKDYATDILSFAPVEPGSLGELVISPAVIKRQSKRTGLSETGELGYMLVHGVLHLLGYDHETSAADEQKMFTLQDQLFAKIKSVVGLR